MVRRVHIPELHKHAPAIGYVCILWGFVESELNFSLALLFKSMDDDAFRALVANMDIREKVEVVRAVGFLQRPSKIWFEELKAALNKIDNVLRPERNRIIHDQWVNDGTLIHRRTHKTKIKRPQAFLETLSFHDDKPMPAKAVWKEAKNIEYAISSMRRVNHWLEMHSQHGSSPPKSEPQVPHPRTRDARPKKSG